VHYDYLEKNVQTISTVTRDTIAAYCRSDAPITLHRGAPLLWGLRGTIKLPYLHTSLAWSDPVGSRQLLEKIAPPPRAPTTIHVAAKISNVARSPRRRAPMINRAGAGLDIDRRRLNMSCGQIRYVALWSVRPLRTLRRSQRFF